jgi:hypothetical protein
MSKYFDERHQWVRQDFQDIDVIEAEVIRVVNLVTGDIEFPGEMRDKIQGIIACNQHAPVGGIMTQGGKMSDITQSSRLISELHSAFHDLASMRIKVRFGRLDDKPDKILKRRDAWLEKAYPTHTSSPAI